MTRNLIVALGLGVCLCPNLVSAQTPPRPAPASSPAPTVAERCDTACVRANADRAVPVCAPRIEAEAPGDFEWISRPYGSIFQEADTPEQPSSAVVRYRGDSIRFLSPQEKWVRAIYECGYDAGTQQVAYVRVRLGVLGKRSAIPAAPQAARTSAASPGTARPAAPAQTAANPGAPQPAAINLRLIGEPSSVDVRQVPAGAKP